MKQEIYQLDSLEDSISFVKDLRAFIQSLDFDNLALLFYAPMGAGKTTLIRELGQQLGIEESITSPTFVGMNQYHFEGIDFYHYDLYQVEINLEELREDMSSGKNIFLFEWSEKLDDKAFELLERSSELVKIHIDLQLDLRVLKVLTTPK